ncbi:N-alpha-acetyltransferase 20 [Hibiscus syriacus]|uniref:N-alpha-acetyltransferase 20 n=1 Tax=Hibiscus syriacus TaxID=106335 RepID=A0A6A3D507_HIBSY|nr:N-alpha-acetyltransferase 20 [Hibiscus syriacus]
MSSVVMILVEKLRQNNLTSSLLFSSILVDPATVSPHHHHQRVPRPVPHKTRPKVLTTVVFSPVIVARWPDYFQVAEGPGKRIMVYIMGKVEGQGESWHGHVTAVIVSPEYRRQQLAKKLMNLLEEISDKM